MEQNEANRKAMWKWEEIQKLLWKKLVISRVTWIK